MGQSFLGTVNEYVKLNLILNLEEGMKVKINSKFYLRKTLAKNKNVKVLIGLNIIEHLPVN